MPSSCFIVAQIKLELPLIWGSRDSNYKPMNKYMLIFRGQEGVDTSDEALKERISLHLNWIEKMGDQHIDSQRLDAIGAHLLTHDAVITDGPFMQDKEIILGYTTILAKDLDEAIFLAKTCPLLNYYEIIVRPLV